ncbi:DUF4136 domain-containing protein [Psychromonas sp.]|uniref:DUF4136 domain-containing protein n=1 Tax=Psychromonas sp. TaxID=1884585 RepID=UPI0035633CB4
MRKKLLLAGLLASLLSVTGCSTSSSDRESKQAATQKKAQRITVVSSANPADALPAFTSFTWKNQYNLVLSAIDNQSEKQLQEHIRGEIIRYLANKGYVYQENPLQADVVLGFLFALEDDTADRVIEKRFGLLPGVNAKGIDAPRYRKGTFLLNVISKDLKKVYWRSAMQGFVDLADTQDANRSAKMQSVLQIMMGDFPQAGR